jgi:hypothetical protein
MKKGMIAIIVFAVFTCLMLTPYAYAAEPSVPHNADAMWVEPEVVDLSGASIGYKFNVTVWVNLTVTCAGWQFLMEYETAFLNATRIGLTAGDKSDFFQNITTFPIAPQFGNLTAKYALIGESWISGPYRSPGYGSLGWVEFEVIAAGPYSNAFDIATAYHPNNSKTYALHVQDVEPPPPPDEIILNVSNGSVVPEFSSWPLIVLLSLISFVAVVGVKRKK